MATPAPDEVTRPARAMLSARPQAGLSRLLFLRRSGPLLRPWSRRAVRLDPRNVTILCKASRVSTEAIPRSDVEVFDLQRVLLDEIAPGFDIVSHQGGEQVVGGGNIFQLDLEERPAGWIHRGFPELLGIHLP